MEGTFWKEVLLALRTVIRSRYSSRGSGVFGRLAEIFSGGVFFLEEEVIVRRGEWVLLEEQARE